MCKSRKRISINHYDVVVALIHLPQRNTPFLNTRIRLTIPLFHGKYEGYMKTLKLTNPLNHFED
jgi:hypothetical protein